MESKKEFKELFKRISSCVSVYEATDNGNDFIFKDIDKATEKVEKIKRKDVIGKSVLKVFPGVKDFGLFDVFKRVYRTGKPENHSISFYKDNRISGWRENFVYKLPSGNVVAVYNDLTEKKRAEEEIKSLAKFPEENPNLVGRADYSGKLLYCNHAYKKIFKDIDHIPAKLGGTIKKIAAKKTFSPEDVEIEIGDWIFLFTIIPIKKESYINFYGKDITEHKKAEEALQESEEKYRTLVEKANESVTILQDGLFVFANRKTHELGGKQEGELTGKPFIDFIWPEDREMIAANHKKRMAGEALPNSFDLRIIGVDGSPVWLSVSVTEIQYKGKPATLNLAFDITERKKAEEALQESEKNLLMAQRLSKIGSWSWIVATDTVQWSEELCHINGHDPKLPVPSFVQMSSFYTPESWKRLNEAVTKAFNTRESYELELDLIRTDGTIIKTIARGEVVYDASGKIEYLHGTVQDITERKIAEEKLKNTQLLLKAGIESPKGMIIFAINKDYNYLFFNQFHKDVMMKAYGKEAEIGMNMLDCMVMEVDKINTKTNFGRALNGESHSTIQEYGYKERNYYETFYSPVINENNEIIGATAFARDITDRKKSEQEILYLSFHDHLTGLYNRRFFEEELKRLDTKRQLPLSFIMGDINGLKLINDVFGHAEGDEVLKKTAEILKKVCRSDDILARWGGDEFVILLPKTSAADSEEIVERIKKECKKTANQKIPMSLSLGASQKETAVQNIQAVIIDAESNMYRNKLIEKESLTSSIIFALDQALYEKSTETKEHTGRIQEFAIKLGKSVKLPSSLLDELSLLASLHDIGKVAISEAILLKEGKLTKQEWEVIKRHPEIGFNIASSSQQIAHIAKPILSCHENFDGSGYPLGLKGESIPVISRIVLIADAYDVMTTGRIYKEPKNKEDAIKELKRCIGTQFDPVLIDKFIEIISS